MAAGDQIKEIKKKKKKKGAETERRRFDMDETFAADLI